MAGESVMKFSLKKMIRGSLILLALFAVDINGEVPLPDGRIIGGESTTIDKFPHQVSVRLLNSHICGGSIVGQRWILTAAHCIYDISPLYYSVSIGSTYVSGGKIIAAERLVKNKEYNPNSLNNDVALILLKSSISFSAAARPIGLATVEPAPGTQAVVSGWGVTTPGGSVSNNLLKVVVDIISQGECAKKYAGVNAITDKMLCAGVPSGGKDACQGDSGGPLIANGVLVGIVSWGVGCAQANYPGVYSNVAELRSWIQSNMV